MKFISSFFKGIASMISSLIHSISSFFGKSYPKDGLDLSAVFQALIAALITLAIGYFFNPFGIDTTNQLLISGGFAFGLSLILSFASSFLTKGNANWSMLSNILKHIVLFVIISIACFLYFNKSIDFESIGLFSLLGLIPTIIYSIVNQNMAETKYVNLATNSNDSLKSMKVDNSLTKSITLESKDGSKKMNFLPNQLISMQENNGNVEITWQNVLKTETSILNTSLKNIEKSIAEYSQFVKCNSSTIVNKYAIKNVSGNSQGISLDVAKLSNSIQVDRTKASVLYSKL